LRFLLRLADLTGRRSVRHVLFLCFYNRRRSATAERVFAKRTDLEVRSAGTSRDALLRVNEHMLDWADVVFIMDEGQRCDLEKMFPGHPAIDRLVSLEIPDDYLFLDPQLVDLLTERVERHLGPRRE
jgi:predicted protein tyrosine phosphatase